MCLMTYIVKAQEKVSIAVLQDVRLATLGDDKGNDSFTLNLIARIKMQGNQSKIGYLIIYPEWEYANLKQVYNRYSANVGYTLNKLPISNLEASLIGGIGMIARESESSSSFNVTGELAYKLNAWFKILLNAQIVQRSDIDKWLCSGFAGLEITVFK